jgi:CHAT domain-containing protein
MNDDEAAFDAAAATHRRELQDLIVQRGLDFNQGLERASLRSVCAWLEHYPASAAALFYTHQAEQLSMWLVRDGALRAAAQIPVSSADLAAEIIAVRQALNLAAGAANRDARLRIAPPHDVRRPAIDLDAALSRLTATLLPPPIVRELGAVEQLIVIPARSLGAAPLAMLQPFDDQSALIDHLSISIAPSLFDLEQIIPFWSPARRRALVVGNPAFPDDPDWIFPDLPGAEREAQAVARHFDSTLLIGPDASKQRVLPAAREAELLYVATHGIADPDDPLAGSFLALAADDPLDGRWTAQEIQSSALIAQLAVLSACQSGLGRAHPAGMIGLARAFQLAGVPRVIMSLWNVNDAATSALMTAFAAQLAERTPAEALRRAMLKAKRDGQPAAHWASFVTFGMPW